MSEFHHTLRCLKKKDATKLDSFNQYVLKRFFEFSLCDHDWKCNVIKWKTSHIRKEHILIIFILSVIQSSDGDVDDIFKILYNDFVCIKEKTDWMGRLQWRDFHNTLISHIVWTGNLNLLIWLLQTIFSTVKSIGPSVEKWRKDWYIREVRLLQDVVVQTSIISKNIHVVNFLMDAHVIRPTKKLERIIAPHGYVFSDNQLIQAPFTDTIEWKYVHEYPTYECNIDIKRLMDICKVSKDHRNTLFNYFYNGNQNRFNDFLFSLTEYEIKYITFSKIGRVYEDFPYLIVQEHHKFILDFIHIIPARFLKILSRKGLVRLPLYEAANSILLHIQNTNIDKHIDNLRNYVEVCVVEGDILSVSSLECSLDEMYRLFQIFGSRLKTESLSENSSDKEYPTCPICLDEITPIDPSVQYQDSSQRLLCGHIFHTKCLEQDVKRTNHIHYHCALCRSRIHPISMNISVNI